MDQVVYDDDVEPKTIQITGPRPVGEVVGGKVKVKWIHRNLVEVEKTKLNVLLELKGKGFGLYRPGIDLVTVLDVSASMSREGRIYDLKRAMRFLVRKLSHIDRLSVVTFSTKATRQRQLLPMTEEAQDLIESDVDDLWPHGLTNMALGLREALKVLNERKHKDCRVAAIMFMSDGDPKDRNAAAQVPVGDVPIYTFAVGSDFKSNGIQILKELAQNGGTFSITSVKNMPGGSSSNLSDAFAKCLGGLLNIAVENVTVTIKPVDEKAVTDNGNTYQVKSTINDVSAGLYPQTLGPDGSITVTFHDLFIQEKRTVLVELGISAVPTDVVTPVLEVSYSYRCENGQAEDPPTMVSVTRTKENPEMETVEVIVEKKRLEAINKMETSKRLANDEKNLPEAKKELETTEKWLDNVDDSAELIEMLKDEVRLLIESMKDENTYNKTGRHILDATLIAHKLQRSATLGNADKSQMYATNTMKEFLDQVKNYEKNYNDLVEQQQGYPGCSFQPNEPICAKAITVMHDSILADAIGAFNKNKDIFKPIDGPRLSGRGRGR